MLMFSGSKVPGGRELIITELCWLSLQNAFVTWALFCSPCASSAIAWSSPGCFPGKQSSFSCVKCMLLWSVLCVCWSLEAYTLHSLQFLTLGSDLGFWIWYLKSFSVANLNFCCPPAFLCSFELLNCNTLIIHWITLLDFRLQIILVARSFTSIWRGNFGS